MLPPIVFTDEDLMRIMVPHIDALNITAKTYGYVVECVMIHQANTVNVMYGNLFHKLGIELEDLTLTDGPLYGFSSERVNPLGTIILHVEVGTSTMATKFMVVDVCSPHNAIFGLPLMRSVGAIALSYHQKLKFKGADTIETIWGTQAASRSSIIAGVHKKKTMVVGVETPPPEVISRKPGVDPMEKVVEDLRKFPIQRDDPDRYFLLGAGLTSEEAEKYENLLMRNLDNFAWLPSEMQGLDPELAYNRLNLLPGAKPIIHKGWRSPDHALLLSLME